MVSAAARWGNTAWSAAVLDWRQLQGQFEVWRHRRGLRQVHLECGRAATSERADFSDLQLAAAARQAADLTDSVQQSKAAAGRLTREMSTIDRNQEPGRVRALTAEIRQLGLRSSEDQRRLIPIEERLGSSVLASGDSRFEPYQRRARAAAEGLAAAEAKMKEQHVRQRALSQSLGLHVRWLSAGIAAVMICLMVGLAAWVVRPDAVPQRHETPSVEPAAGTASGPTPRLTEGSLATAMGGTVAASRPTSEPADVQEKTTVVDAYRRAAEAGSSDGMFNLGLMYDSGQGVAKDDMQAIRWYRKAAEAGNSYGMNNLGVMYRDGTGVPRDAVEAATWFRKAAQAGNGLGMTNMGRCYAQGWGVAQDATQAASWFQKAANVGSTEGMVNLGKAYYDGNGVARSLTEAAKWFRLAAEAGSAEGMNSFGVCLLDGSGVPIDPAEGAKWCRKAAVGGSAREMNSVGVCFRDGTGIPKDSVEAAKWFRKSAEAGSPDGMVNLGKSYFDGGGVAKDSAEAIKWFRKAADRGDAFAMFNIGVCYRDGLSVAGDPAEALKWLRRAAEAGLPEAMYEVGVCYANGVGAAADPVEAARWHLKAADAGHKRAREALAERGSGGRSEVADAHAQATIRYYNRLVEIDDLPPVSTPTLLRRVARNIAAVPVGQEVDAELVEYAKKRISLYSDYADAFERQDYITTAALMADFGRRPGLTELKAKLVQKYSLTTRSR